MGYMINFIVYTAAMIGIIFLAVFVYKKCSINTTSKSKFLNVEECISIGPRKELFIVKAGNERFLVASDVGRTSLISKLDDNSGDIKNVVEMGERQNITSQNKCSIDDLPEIVNIKNIRQPKKVFKNIINNI